jgi:hypothetical protein
MKRRRRFLRRERRFLRSASVLALEVGLYAVLVIAYLATVLRLLRPYLLRQEHQHRTWYAILALLLMLGQGAVLEILTTSLVGFFTRARREDELSS